MSLPDSLLISSLLEGYRARNFSPREVIERVLAEIARAPDRNVWITLLPRERLLEYAAALEGRAVDSLPLYGVPFAIKDNIDLEDVPTTAGCPDYAYIPTKSAFVVRKLIAAGAIPIGKTNLDQFATGLVGTRSPYGACQNSFDPTYISGGSSSGSAVAVATGFVSFSLGTDTAGSGRVPAGFNNIIGLKPTCGALSTSGVVPACRSLDCVSIFALTAADAAHVYRAAVGFDPDDIYSRPLRDGAQSAHVATVAGASAGPSVAGAIVDSVAGANASTSAVGDPIAGTKAGAAKAADSVAGARPMAAVVGDPVARARPGANGDRTSGAAALARDNLGASGGSFRFGVPRASQLQFFGDGEYNRLFEASVRRLEALGGLRVEIDFQPFLAAARLLYEGPWVAERYCAVGDFVERQPQSVHPVTRQIISGGRDATAVDAFRSQYRLMELRRAADQAWLHVDVLVTPTAGTIYLIEELEADPIRLNSNLGYYTNFVNLLDLSAVALPTGFRSDGLPFGISILAPAGGDEQLLSLADRFHRAEPARLGALSVTPGVRASPTPAGADIPLAAPQRAPSTAVPSALPPFASQGSTSPSRTSANASASAASTAAAATRAAPGAAAIERISVAVCGAHMEGLPLNHQLTSRGAVLLIRTRTAPVYKFYALPGGPPHRPGLVRVPKDGASIDVEVWSVPAPLFGSFVAGIPAPLGIGKVQLEDNTQVAGFVCESYATSNATDITSLGSWRRYRP